MRPKGLRRLPLSVIAAAILAAGAWAGWLAWTHVEGRASLLDRIEAPLADLRLLLAGQRPVPPDVVIAAIDDETVAGEGGYPLDRRRLVDLVRAIDAAGAKALAVDILLVDPTTPDADAALAGALGGMPSVIAAAGQFDRADRGVSAVPRTTQELWPLTPFAQAASVGLVNVSTDVTGVPRHLPLAFQTARGPMPSLTLRAVGLLDGENPVLTADAVRIAGRSLPLDLGWHLPLRFYGPARTFPTISAKSLLAGERPSQSLTNKIVVLGVTATAIGDTFGTPFDPVTPGVEVLATGIANLVGGGGLLRDPDIRRIDAAAALLLAISGVVLVASIPLAQGIGLAAAAILAWLAAVTVLYGHGYWLSGALPLAACLPPIGLTALARQVHDRRQASALAKAEQALRLFQPPALVDRIARDPGFLAEPMQQAAAILFVDLSGFTLRSEQLGPARTQDFLKQFHTIVVDEIAVHRGVVMNFMGDGAMVVFGIPVAEPDDAARAMAASFALLARVRKWIGTTSREAGSLDLRIGVHYGPVMFSRLGHDSHQQITASGDSVNVASRLMEVGKAHGAAIVASEALLDATGESREALGAPHEMRAMAIRGRRQPIGVALWGSDVAASGPASSISATGPQDNAPTGSSGV